MKRFRAGIIFFTIFLLKANTCLAWQPAVSADAAVLMDANTGQVLYAKNAHKRRPPASTTKILTGILALDMGNPAETVVVSPRAAAVGESSIYLSAGEKLTLDELIQGALMKSGNDACAAIAEHIGGSIEMFSQLMNLKAKMLGAWNSNFINPHGLPAKNHYSTAYDLALIARYAMQNQRFAEIVAQKEKEIDWYGQSWNRHLKNTNKLLWRYIWADGIKTGTTKAAGQCLVSSASKDCRKLIAVVLKSGDRYGDSIQLFEYGFNNYYYQQVAVAGEYFGYADVQNGLYPKVQLAFKSDLGVLVPKDRPGSLEKRLVLERKPQAPVKAGQTLGWMEVNIDRQRVGRVELVALNEVPENSLKNRVLSWIQKIIG
ncbi:serine-type D-Ala-D-Ala carboxypeptidase [Thermincola ferriacetica]|uniref:serine-type D-Ala-D-Ala carboxypeptidase n=1 Tax=Thermincola ferriacetica TaxID=281456 RepID=A0A0L6W1G7_9FIRM|nr:D-alanyl-D-alanine carboxypeptidase family protein [Thermincola ferriacetica]KNZ69321.1 serine-type D-Ala-D-Ala carboxypeptidase [Thermincola ferriacetica]